MSRKTSRMCHDLMWCAAVDSAVIPAVIIIVLVIASIIFGGWYAYTH